MANVELPAALRAHAGNLRHITVAATTVGAALQAVQLAHPALQGFLVDSTGVVPRHIVIFVGNADIRHGHGLATAVTDDTVITVLLPVAGGAGAGPAPATSNRPALSSADIQRYGRQLLLPWMSGQAQRRFRTARVPIALIANDPASHWLCVYLAHAGVGHLELQGADDVCNGPIDRHDVLGSPLLRMHDLGTPRAQQLQRQLTQRVPQLGVSIVTTTSAADAIADTADAVSDAAADAGTALRVQGNGSISNAMWQGSHAAAIWLRRTATQPED